MGTDAAFIMVPSECIPESMYSMFQVAVTLTFLAFIVFVVVSMCISRFLTLDNGISFYFQPNSRALTLFTLRSRQVNMTPQMAQPAHSAGQMLAQMSRQNGAPQSVTPSSTSSPLHGGPAGGWNGAAAGVRPQFNNQVNQRNRINSLIVLICPGVLSQC